VSFLLLQIDDTKHHSGYNTIFLLTWQHFRALNLFHWGQKKSQYKSQAVNLAEMQIKADKISHHMRFLHHIDKTFYLSNH
jgi:hypothetical protein